MAQPWLGAASGWYDRRPAVSCIGEWLLQPGDAISVVWFDDYSLESDGAAREAISSGKTAGAPLENTFEATMAGYIGADANVLPQHWIARFMLLEEEEPTELRAVAPPAAVEAPIPSPFRCCCGAVRQLLQSPATNSRLAQLAGYQTFENSFKDDQLAIARAAGIHVTRRGWSKPNNAPGVFYLRTANDNINNTEFWEQRMAFCIGILNCG